MIGRRLLPGDPAARYLASACALALLACLPLGVETQGAVFRYLAVVDITRSMTVTDYRLGNRMVSRLDFVRHELLEAIAGLPCGSQLGLGVFTERSSTLLFEPIEVCAGFQDIVGTLERLDWRMAWAADSRIAAGLLDAFQILAGYQADLLFFTDGQEAPPVNPRYRARFDGVRGRLGGLLVGVGGSTPMPIPKFDETGKPLGFVAEDEVPQRSTFGLSEMAPEDIEGYHARNAPFGSAPLGGTEHLSALREDYLRELAGASGLGYRRLEADTLAEALLQPEYAKPARVFVDLRWIPATLALALTVFAYLQGRIHAADAATRARPAGFWRAALPWRRGRLSAADP